jgi:hypothetical protein
VRAANAAGQDVTTWVADALATHLELPDIGQRQNVPVRCPEPVVIVRLAPRPPGERRTGWVSNMDDNEWWEAASCWWRLAAKTRAMSRFLAAADPYGIVHRVWRISGWEPDESATRWAAVSGVDILRSNSETDVAMVQSLVGRALPRSRNPVTLR